MEQTQTPPEETQQFPEDKEMPDISGKSFNEFQAELEEYLAELMEEIPEVFRGLLPKDIGIISQVRWARSAIKSGLFSASRHEADGPGAYRPTTKKTADLSGMTPHQLMSMGYGQK